MMTEDQKKLYAKISEILWNDWDPIGVNTGNSELDDEYQSYVPQMYRLATDGKSTEDISKHLTSIVTERMRLEPDEGHSLKVAELIVKAVKE